MLDFFYFSIFIYLFFFSSFMIVFCVVFQVWKAEDSQYLVEQLKDDLPQHTYFYRQVAQKHSSPHALTNIHAYTLKQCTQTHKLKHDHTVRNLGVYFIMWYSRSQLSGHLGIQGCLDK